MAVDGWIACIAAFAVWLAGCLGGLVLVRRRASPASLRQHHDIAGIIYAAVAVVYAVLLAFVAVVAWERHEAVETHAAKEAAALVDLYRATNGMPPDDAGALRAALRNYVRMVIDDEWVALARGERSALTDSAVAAMWRAYLTVDPVGEGERIWLAEAIDRLGESGEERQLRLLGARRTIPGPLWLVLLLGAAITVAFSFLLAAPSGVLHGVMVVLLSSAIGLVLLLVFAFQKPFSGPVRVEPTAFIEAMAAFEAWDRFGR
ncbi:MAG TPA: DUF4239 domain-containing protein [Longimicrobiales bacterium]|nr:DUF4239 domain-containing protein [Longimicrobiales bacterium]